MLAISFTGDQNTQAIAKTFNTNNGFGVASIAGVTSRNGRVSSISGVNFFPSGTNPFYFQGRSGEKIPEPISFAKEEDGRFTAGQIKYGPGSVSVTSIARSVDSNKAKSVKAMSTVQNMFMPSQFKPRDMNYQDPFSTFNTRSPDPWFPNTFMYRQPFQSFNSMKPRWAYSNINPFLNYWRR